MTSPGVAATADSPLAPPARRPIQAVVSALLLALWILFLAGMAYRG